MLLVSLAEVPAPAPAPAPCILLDSNCNLDRRALTQDGESLLEENKIKAATTPGTIRTSTGCGVADGDNNPSSYDLYFGLYGISHTIPLAKPTPDSPHCPILAFHLPTPWN